MSYGEKIAALRKSRGMTQAALGAELNVTYQAVSKWERDESDPDFATMCKIARLFEVPLTFFEDAEEATASQPQEQPAATKETESEVTEETAFAVASAAESAPAEEKEAEPAPRMLGVCSVCGRSIYAGELGESNPRLVCKTCKTRFAKERERKALEQQRKAEYERSRLIRRRNIGLIVSGSICGAVLIAAIVGFIISSTDILFAAMGVGAILLFLFPFIAQLFWDGFIVDVCMLGGKIIGTPGVIFSFDLDGFIFLIGMKILFALLKVLFFVLSFLFMIFIAIVFSPFAFGPQIAKISKGKEL